MADSSSNLTSLARALSHHTLDLVETNEVSPPRPSQLHPCRRRKLSSSNSLDSLAPSTSSPCATEARVLVINTGGTIGMTLHDNVLAPKANAFVNSLRKLPILHDEMYAEQTSLYDYYGSTNTLVLPLSKENKRIVYTILEYNPLLDSSNMTTDDWGRIGKDIEKNYENYDGFVILHGTDTMAYTAAALSFMCEHLGKPIILTGSQVPIYEMRNDGRDNLLGALLIAGQFVIPEVCLYFYNKLYRGNRVTKVDAGSFNAFSSPNLAPLATAEVDIMINWDTVWRANTTAKFQVSTELNRNVGLLRLFPGITAATVRAFLQPPMQGVVLETYGSGNAPDKRPDLLEELKKATDSGVIIINCTQCLRGSVSTSYATGKVLIDAGLTAGGDMISEAALSKLSYVLAKKDISLDAKKKMMAQNLRGEMNVDNAGAKLNLSDSRFIQVIAKSLSISCKEELEAIRDALTPPLACAAAKIGDIEALEALKEMGSNLCLGDYDGRTPLHVAACEGHLKVVQYLLSHGATVYAKDRYRDTPLYNAVRFRHREVVKLLRKTGAHFSRDELDEAGTELCSLAASGDLEGLEIWCLAGADLNKPGYDGQTAIQVAHAVGQTEVEAFLLQAASKKTQSAFGEINEFDEYDDDDDESGVIEFTAAPSGM
ncbi:60 kDa lysophospholipase isoform X1 [Synchiropus splendidus]|uniref:60 kDa lysophospholipase isoform X1 n=1 Tax=Synchiropus splendidus TaxID=270530 RepID=UPI00237DC772|nr:60 kDa lysophospholipase isoform X1 [Synchiropus splendidus]XP_053701163.1 60 kDa lysophospholipase isoform X1 [Synchiropus splendidus]